MLILSMHHGGVFRLRRFMTREERHEKIERAKELLALLEELKQ
jgi:hypothetical protein